MDRNRAFILLGSNIDKERNLPAAARLLAGLCDVRALSTVYETVPVGRSDQPTFLNAAAFVETELTAGQLKGRVLTTIEVQLKRQRSSDKNAPRTIDADIILFNQEILDYNGHHIPDPDLLRFPHVAVPVAELAPTLPHPETGEPLGQLAARLLATSTVENNGRPPLWPRPDVIIDSH